MTLFTYTVSKDYGFAPNPFWATCTLACCKPGIRKSAEIGDLIVGFGGADNKLVGKVIYAMVVKDFMTFREYWDDKRFQVKKPNIYGSPKGFFGDNIYRWDKHTGQYQQENSHHSMDDGSTNPKNLKRDTGVDRILIASDYVYFGNDAIAPSLELCDSLPCKFPHRTRNYYKNYPPEVRPRVEKWLRAESKWGLRGLPERWKSVATIQGRR